MTGVERCALPISYSYGKVSFWAKSSKAGTYCVSAKANDVGAKYYPFEYTLAADTWTKVTHSIPGDSALVFNNDSGSGLDVRWVLVAGSSRQGGTDGAWGATSTSNMATSNQVNFFDSTSNDFYLTGVQLEVGEKATPFEHRSFGDELARCQRYRYQIDLGNSTAPLHIVMARFEQGSGVGYAAIQFPCEMRSNPNFSFTGGTLSASGYAGNPVLNRATKSSCDIKSTRSISANNTVYLRAISGGDSSDVLILNFDSEL